MKRNFSIENNFKGTQIYQQCIGIRLMDLKIGFNYTLDHLTCAKKSEICYWLEKTEKSSTLTASSTGIDLSKELVFRIY